MAAAAVGVGMFGALVCFTGYWLWMWFIDPILFLSILEIEDTEGTLYLSQTPSASSRSRISQAKIPGSFCFSSLMKPTTFGVVTLGLLPPIAPGRIEPVSL